MLVLVLVLASIWAGLFSAQPGASRPSLACPLPPSLTPLRPAPHPPHHRPPLQGLFKLTLHKKDELPTFLKVGCRLCGCKQCMLEKGVALQGRASISISPLSVLRVQAESQDLRLPPSSVHLPLAWPAPPCRITASSPCRASPSRSSNRRTAS